MNYNKTNWVKYNETVDQLIETKIIPLENTLTLDEIQETFTEILITAATTSTPVKSNNKTHKYTPYWNTSCDTAIKNRRKSEKLMRSNPTQENIINYKRNKAIVKITIKQTKIIYWEKYCKQLNKNSNISNIWKTINRTRGLSQISNHSTLLKTLKLNNMPDLCNNFAKYFQAMSSDSNVEETFKIQKEKAIHTKLNSLTKLENLTKEIQNDITKLNQSFTIQELNLSLISCNKKSSSGPDSISYILLDNLSNKGKQTYLNLVNRSWEEGQLPTNWKTAFVKPIIKHNKPKNAIESFRPISLISNMSKIMEKMINTRLKWFLEKNQLINKFQFGFRQNHNTIDHLYRLKEEIQFSLENKNSTIAVALDYTKAFDLVWRDGLLVKMMSLNIRGKIINWIKNFLNNRNNIIKIENFTSNPYGLDNGIPQGSSLSPTLFLIMINDFPSLSTYTSQSLFADDANIWRSGTNLKQIAFHLQEDLLEIDKWSSNWGFIINKEKTTATIFTNKNNTDTV
jgi:hypothetical protein